MSDNVSPVCPEVMEAIIAANTGTAASYGDDEWTARVQDRFSDIFERRVKVFPAVSGTATNALSLSALTPSYGKVYCHGLAHINSDECGAPEFFTGGAKLIPVPGESGKITAAALSETVFGRGNVHHAQPAAVSIAQACETGRVYQVDEIEALSAAARDNGLKVHMDGARFANALSTLGVSPADVTWKAGVDVLSFGGTKNGCLAAEAVVFFDPDAADQFEYLHKRSGQLLSKMRYIAAQLKAYVADDLWLRNASHANAMAKRLSDGLAALPGLDIAYPTQSNEVFVKIPAEIVAKVSADGFEVNEEELDGSAARFVCAWNTDVADVDRLLTSFQTHCK
ncbi:MAG: threonine aldolase family protein [Pikeienuella sp.]